MKNSAQHILTEHLKLKPYKNQERQLQIEAMKAARLERCRQLKCRFVRNLHRRIVFSDEKLFTNEQGHNRQNDRGWAPGTRRIPLDNKEGRQSRRKTEQVKEDEEELLKGGHNMLREKYFYSASWVSPHDQSCLNPTMQSSASFLSIPFLLLSASSGLHGLDPCPHPEEILPCVCYNDEEGNYVILDCSAANSSSQISSAFNDASWPATNLTGFSLVDDNQVEELPEGVFNNVAFKTIYVDNSTMASLHPSALLSSQDQLDFVYIRLCPMKEFPWDTLPQLTSLTALYLKYNRLTAIPSIQSPSLDQMILSHNRISNLEAEWFAPSLTFLDLSDNPISTIPHGFFEGFQNLTLFACRKCELGPTLLSGTLEFYSENLQYVILIHNNISSIEPNAIAGLTPDTTIYLQANNITELTEEVFRPILEVLVFGSGYINLWGVLHGVPYRSVVFFAP
ncbi:unnamed protein product [Darwinula stevensoni]|uniref:Uncharacterized protein n=1 Tax=Darwinula stevensoni TaxID=69355 RepID=A0A7R8X8V9_9CRUS|nr:unnamed protein product [Darwinula stevensoni]CAG0884912.1 unnamed protein product [Darwinula stevensoni]